MNQLKTNLPDCPNSDTLREYLLGKMEPVGMDQFEGHLSECADCHETLRGLTAEDTFSSQVAQALEPVLDATQARFEDDVVVQRLIDRLTDPSQLSGDVSTGEGETVKPATRYEMELMADRAAEVLRCLESDDARLGLLGHYELIRLIGAGSSGVVFLAKDTTLDRTVAVKVLRPSLGPVARERFLAEAKAAAKIDHPNVIAIYHVGQQDRLAYIVMKWSPGQTLETQLQTQGTFSEAEVRRLVIEIAKGLDAAQQQQLIHRDVKPANVWVSEEGPIQLLDFGLARVADDESSLTATGMLAGTPNYMSPEQAKGLELDGRSDLFSLGCVMYRLLTGRLPFGSSTVLGTLQAIQNEQPATVQSLCPDVSDELNDLTMATLEKQPANRPESAVQLIDLLNKDRRHWRTSIPRYHSVSMKNELPQPAAKMSNWMRAGIGLLIGMMMLGPLSYYLGPQIIRLVTNQGELVIETADGEEVQIEILENGKRYRLIDVASDSSFDIKSGTYQIQANPKSGVADVNFEISPKSLTMTRGGKQIVKVTQVVKSPQRPLDPAFEDATGLKLNGLLSSPPTDAPTYNGNGFGYWMKIARTDRHPETFAEALAACAELADSDESRQLIIGLIREKVRKHNLAAYGANTITDRMLDSFLRAFRSFPKKMAAEFALEEFRSGNGNSQAFASWLLPSRMLSHGELPILTADAQAELSNAFLSDSSTWLRLVCETEDAYQQQALMKNVVSFTYRQSTEKLIKLDPQLGATIAELEAQLKSIESARGERIGYLLLNRMGVDQSDYVQKFQETYRPENESNLQSPACRQFCNYWLLPWPSKNAIPKSDGRLLNKNEIELRLNILLTTAIEFADRNRLWVYQNTIPFASTMELLLDGIFQHMHYCSDEKRKQAVNRLQMLKLTGYFRTSVRTASGNPQSVADAASSPPPTPREIDMGRVKKTLDLLLKYAETGDPDDYQRKGNPVLGGHWDPFGGYPGGLGGGGIF